MLNNIRYILSTWHRNRKVKQHRELLGQISEEDALGIAVWHCKDYIEFKDPLTLDDRLRTVVSVTAPSAHDLLSYVEQIHTVILAESKTVLPSLPYWVGRPATTIALDTWLVDPDGYFVELDVVINQLFVQLSQIQQTVALPAMADLEYHYTKKPSAVYRTITQLLQQL